MPTSAQRTAAGLDLDALDAITEAVESGAGIPEIVRAAARTLDASLILSDRAGSVHAVAVRSPAEEVAMSATDADVELVELRVADTPVGMLRVRFHGEEAGAALLRLVTTLVASEMQRIGAPARASEQAVSEFLAAALVDGLAPEDLLARAERLGIDLTTGASVGVVRVHAHATEAEGWRERVAAVVQRGARAVVAGAVAAPSVRTGAPGAEIALLLPTGDGPTAARACESVVRELQSTLTSQRFAIGLSRVAADAADLRRARNEALLAANVAEGDAEQPPVLAFDDTGAYRLLLSAMAEDPAELQRFYADTIEPLVAYDEQYETTLVATVEAFLEADGNVAGTAQRLFTHRHTIRYRLERVRDLSGLDVGSTDGREKLSLGLKAMRVLGIASRGGPATEQGSSGGRVPRRD